MHSEIIAKYNSTQQRVFLSNVNVTNSMGVTNGRLAPHRGGNTKLDGGGTYHALRSVNDPQIGWLLNNPHSVTSELSQDILRVIRNGLGNHPDIAILRRQGIAVNDDEDLVDADAETLNLLTAGPRNNYRRIAALAAANDPDAFALAAAVSPMDAEDMHQLMQLRVANPLPILAAAARDGLCTDTAENVAADNYRAQRRRLNIGGTEVSQVTETEACVPIH